MDYKAALGSKYVYIYAIEDENPVNGTCATPTITYSDGELQFASNTQGVQYHFTITDADMANDMVSEDGTQTNITLAKTHGIVASSHDGVVTVSGLDNNEIVRFYAVDGKQIGSVRAIDGVASQAVSANSLVIAKIAGQAIKNAVK